MNNLQIKNKNLAITFTSSKSDEIVPRQTTKSQLLYSNRSNLKKKQTRKSQLIFSNRLNLKKKLTRKSQLLSSKKSNLKKKLENNVENKNANDELIKVGKYKHFSPANKEWKNSTYAYNKNNIRSVSVLDEMAGKIIKGYFNLSNNKNIARSKRMRILKIRSTVKRLFVSKPEIKQTSDKVIITVYTFDREKQFYIRKLYFYNKSLNLYKFWLSRTLYLSRKDRNRIKKGIKARKTHFFKMYKREARKPDFYFKNFVFFKKKNTINTSITPLKKMFKNNVKALLSKPVKRTANPLYANSLIKKNFWNLDYTGRNLRNKTYIHKLLLKKVCKINRYFLSRLRRRKKIQKRANVILFNRIRRNYFSKLFSKKLGLSLRKNRLYFKRLINNRKWKTRSFKRKRRAKFAKNFFFKRRKRIWKRNWNRKRIWKRNWNRKKKTYVRRKIRIPYFNLKLKKEMQFFFFKLAYVRKFDYLRKLFFFSFMKYALSLFQTKVKVYYKAHDKRNKKLILKFTVSNPEKNNLDTKYYKLIKNYSNNKLKLMQRINMELLQFLDLILENNNLNEKTNNKEKIYSLYEYFKANYFLLFLKKSLKKELLALNYYTKFTINQYKFGKFLPGLKLLISKIYSKKVELNLVNLKYPHLNSDIYTESVATILKKKKGLLKVLRRSLSLVRKPRNLYIVDNTNNINTWRNLVKIKSLNVNSGVPLNIKDNNSQVARAKDKMDVILNKLYPNSLSQSFNLNSFIMSANKNILKYKASQSTLKYKTNNNILKYKASQNTLKYKANKNILNKYIVSKKISKKYKTKKNVLNFKARLIFWKKFKENKNNLKRYKEKENILKKYKANENILKKYKANKISLKNKVKKVNNLIFNTKDPLNDKKVGLVAKNVKVLNQIRYKWVTGVRLETAGRLTRRYTASRSVYKFKYKGNLKNIDYSLKLNDNEKYKMRRIMLRNQVKPNLQYSFAKSKRRIGAFGIKGWINSI